MGTRRSRHNKGRSPVYKDHRSVASNILQHKRYGGLWLDNGRNWQPCDLFALEVLCEADADIEGAADALARPPTNLAWRAREIGVTLPIQWSRLIAPKRKPQLAERATNYPYIIAPRADHADLMAVNAIIPKSIPDNMRADMCQEIMLAILEGRTTLEVLRSRDKSGSYFIRKFYRDNLEQSGHALSFNDVDEDWSSDSVASSIASREWHREQFAERTRFADSIKTFTPPTQFEAVWNDQIGKQRLRYEELGMFLSHEEVEEMMEEASS